LQQLTEEKVEASKYGRESKVPIIKQLNSHNGQRVRERKRNQEMNTNLSM